MLQAAEPDSHLRFSRFLRERSNSFLCPVLPGLEGTKDGANAEREGWQRRLHPSPRPKWTHGPHP